MKTTKRQIHETKGSFYCYLPKSWVKSYKIKKNDMLSLMELFDGSLLLSNVSSSNESSDPLQQVNLNLDEIGKDEGLLKQYIVGAYIIGANQINFISKKKISFLVRDTISSLIRNLPGFELINESTSKIQSKEIGQISDINSILQTLISTSIVMLKALIDLDLSGSQKEIEREIKAIQSKDEDVDRFVYMVLRLSHKILSDPFLGIKLKVNPVSTLHFTQIANYIERIGDHCSLLADDFIKHKSKMEIIVKEIKPYLKILTTNFEFIATIYKTGTYKETLTKLRDFAEFEREMQKKVNTGTCGFSFYHVSRIASYIVNIQEIILDQTAFDLLNQNKGSE